VKDNAGIKSASFRMLVNAMLSPGIPVMFVEEAFQKQEDLLFLDCREKAEYDVSYLPGTLWIGYSDFELSRLQNIQTSTAIVVYCSVGKRSDVMAKRLMAANYTNVKNLVGGLFEWANQGYAVYKGCEQTDDVHVYNRFWGRWLKRGNKIY